VAEEECSAYSGEGGHLLNWPFFGGCRILCGSCKGWGFRQRRHQL